MKPRARTRTARRVRQTAPCSPAARDRLACKTARARITRNARAALNTCHDCRARGARGRLSHTRDPPALLQRFAHVNPVRLEQRREVARGVYKYKYKIYVLYRRIYKFKIYLWRAAYGTSNMSRADAHASYWGSSARTTGADESHRCRHNTHRYCHGPASVYGGSQAYSSKYKYKYKYKIYERLHEPTHHVLRAEAPPCT
jgi:hypothetical protein